MFVIISVAVTSLGTYSYSWLSYQDKLHLLTPYLAQTMYLLNMKLNWTPSESKPIYDFPSVILQAIIPILKQPETHHLLSHNIPLQLSNISIKNHYFVTNSDIQLCIIDTGTNMVIINYPNLLSLFIASTGDVKGIGGNPVQIQGHGKLNISLRPDSGKDYHITETYNTVYIQ